MEDDGAEFCFLFLTETGFFAVKTFSTETYSYVTFITVDFILHCYVYVHADYVT